MSFHRNVRFACCSLSDDLIKSAWRGGAWVCTGCEARALELLGIQP